MTLAPFFLTDSFSFICSCSLCSLQDSLPLDHGFFASSLCFSSFPWFPSCHYSQGPEGWVLSTLWWQRGGTYVVVIPASAECLIRCTMMAKVPLTFHRFLLLTDTRKGWLTHFGYIQNQYSCPWNESFLRKFASIHPNLKSSYRLDMETGNRQWVGIEEVLVSTILLSIHMSYAANRRLDQ